MFANNQHAIGKPAVMFEHWLQAFRSALESTGKMVMVLSPWHDPDTLKRTWCVYEVYLSIVLNARFEVAMGKSQKADFLADIKKPSSVLRMLGQINSSKSITTVSSDRDLIFELIDAQVGFVKLDRMVFDVLQGWIMRAVDKQIELAATAEEQFEWVFTKAMRLFEGEELDDARLGFQTSVDIFKTSLPPSFWQGWEAQVNLGTLRAKQLHARESWEPICVEALSALQNLVDRDHPAVFRAKLEVGDAYCWNRVFDLGMPLLEDASQLAEEFHGPEETLEAKHRIGLFLFVQGRLADAEAILLPAYEGFGQVYGPSHKATSICRGNLATYYARQGRYREAEALMAWNVEELRRTLSELHEDVLTTMMNLGAAQRSMGKYEDAERNIQKSLDGFQREDNHVYALYARRQLGLLKFCQGDLVVAKTCLEAVHEAFLEILPPTRPSCRDYVLERYIVSFELGSEFDTVHRIDAFQLLLEAANIDNDTWTQLSCHKCFKRIDGDVAICAQCPRHRCGSAKVAWLLQLCN